MKRMLFLLVMILAVSSSAFGQEKMSCISVEKPFRAEACFPKNGSEFPDAIVRLEVERSAPIIQEVRYVSPALDINGSAEFEHLGSNLPGFPLTSSTPRYFYLIISDLVDNPSNWAAPGKYKLNVKILAANGQEASLTNVGINIKETKLVCKSSKRPQAPLKICWPEKSTLQGVFLEIYLYGSTREQRITSLDSDWVSSREAEGYVTGPIKKEPWKPLPSRQNLSVLFPSSTATPQLSQKEKLNFEVFVVYDSLGSARIKDISIRLRQ